ncbi:helix-turn-helix transcriptional regulator [Clostridium sp. MB40-C1]|uniref:helix-turn-helix domain-containing protein n=1 Tax=Clostridium sp. MB40-C1 TaxID=3070996 RepID=UPI0027E1D156|nr:helix-turn-helix transcriptional regulator [Clostridium sp. MB40-C1]WMJ81466.1 helix-turn-helix transcriptional regulator [Clostridium sp. MB40-C1]
MKDMNSFKIKVKKRLVELNMTQRALAKELNTNENYLTDILAGRKSRTKYIEAINDYLGIKKTDKYRLNSPFLLDLIICNTTKIVAIAKVDN